MSVPNFPFSLTLTIDPEAVVDENVFAHALTLFDPSKVLQSKVTNPA